MDVAATPRDACLLLATSIFMLLRPLLARCRYDEPGNAGASDAGHPPSCPRLLHLQASHVCEPHRLHFFQRVQSTEYARQQAIRGLPSALPFSEREQMQS